MKQGIHPKWFSEAKAICACGAVWVVGSTKEEVHVEVCAKCHPFFTGEAKYIDVLGKVDTFLKKKKKHQAIREVKTQIKKAKEKKVEEEKERPKSLKELLSHFKKAA